MPFVRSPNKNRLPDGQDHPGPGARGLANGLLMVNGAFNNTNIVISMI